VVVPDQFWKEVTQVSVTSAVLLPFEELTMSVLPSEPRLFATTIVTVCGEPPVLVKTFNQRANWSLSGTNTLRDIWMLPDVWGGKTIWRLTCETDPGHSVVAGPFWL
jgi:hypothetical protein